MLWYVLVRYVYVLLGNAHLEGEPGRVEEVRNAKHIHLTHYELFGLKEIVMYLYDLPPHKKNVPDLIRDPVALIKDVRTLVERHCKDSPELAITNRPILGEISNERERRESPPMDETESDTGGFVSPAKTAAPPPNNRYGPRGPYKKHNTAAAQGGSSSATTSPTAGDGAVAGHSAGNNGGNGEGLKFGFKLISFLKYFHIIFSSTTQENPLQSVRSVSTVGLWRVQFLSGHGQVRWSRTCQTDLYDATVSAAHVASHCSVCLLPFGWLASDTSIAHGQGTRAHGRSFGVIGVRHLL